MEFLSLLYQLILTTVFIYSIILGRKFGFSTQNYLFIYLFVTICIESFSVFEQYFIKWSSNGFLYNFYIIFCMSFFYQFYKKKLIKNLNKMITIIYFGFMIFNLFILDFFNIQFDYRLGITCSVFYIILALIWFIEKMIIPNKDKITNYPKFYISSGLVLWGIFFIFRSIPMYYFEEVDAEFQKTLVMLFFLVNIFFYILMIMSLNKSKKISFEK